MNGGTLWLIDSAVVENATTELDPMRPGSGGGIFNTGELNIVNSTIGGNVTDTTGGGILNEGAGTVRLLGATITGNQSFGGVDINRSRSPTCNLEVITGCPVGGSGIYNAGDARVTILSSVIAGNHASPGLPGPECFGVITSKGFNAFGDLRDCTVQRSAHADGPDQTGVDPKLADLVDDDRAGKAHFPLLPDSPLIDAGGRVFKQCTPRDQIGQRRKDGDGDGKVECDTGAIEFR